MDTSRDMYFDRYTRLMAGIFKMPMAAVSLIDENRQWFKSSVGIEVCETPLEESFCVHALEQDMLEIPDTQEDDFFQHHPVVVGSPFIRFYLGVVLRGPTGHPLGTLCIMDTQPRCLSRAQRSRLVKFGHLVEELINRDHARTGALNGPGSRSGGHVFRYETEKTALRRHTIEQSLGPALLDNRLFRHYQPLVAADGSRIVGFEALARWQDGKLGSVSPGDFVPIARKNARLSRLLTEWLLRTVCGRARHWPIQPGDAPLRIALNIPAMHFYEKGFVDRVLRTLDEHELAPERLTLELTEESLMVNVNTAIRAMNDLRSHNINLALDDFGTGYSSLRYLKDLPIDTLKIDKSVIDDLSHDSRSANLVEGIIRIAHGLDLEVVAEGVEHETQRALLQEFGCDLMQGYLFSRPLLADDAMALLKSWPLAS